MIKLLYSIILICIYYIGCICIYIGYSQWKIKGKNEKFKKMDQTIGISLSTALANWKLEQKINEESIRRIKRVMKRKIYEEYICNFFLKKVKEDEATVITFIKETKVLNSVFKKEDKSEFDTAYKVKLIGQFKLKDYEAYLLKNCKNSSIYVQITALHSLSSLGDVNSFVLGLKNMLTTNTLVEMKIISDKISKFNGDKQALNDRLKRELTRDDTKLNKVILEHFINVTYIGVQEKLCLLLNDTSLEKELKLACIKYFIKIKNGKAKELLIKLLQDENWEIRALSATALNHYKEQAVRDALKEVVKDENWYVRQNAARTLFYLATSKRELFDIINGTDKYASDAMLSILSEENCLEQYLYGIKIEGNVKDQLQRLVTEEGYFVESLA
ncbi:MAG: HEAT repeat domain-containing protein [Bacillaceae bacterium]